MTTNQRRKLLQRVVDIQHDIEELKRVRLEVLTSGYSSATISTTGGSKTYSRMDAQKITDAITQLQQELKSVRNILGDQASKQITTIQTIYS